MQVKLKQNIGSFYSNDIERFQGLLMVDPGALPASKMDHFATVVNGVQPLNIVTQGSILDGPRST